ncbi:MAG: hypothetical protein WBZ36_19530 [Candidatus Nitrosopolaris sp.]|jgi:hypothetical protein
MLLVVIGYCAKIMNYPLRNLIYEKIKQAGNMTDAELINILTKDGVPITEPELDKALLDLEIYGLVRVSWLTKDKRRIEAGLVDSDIG